jgi:asparagine synthase (glutamine-hydrolysing)
LASAVEARYPFLDEDVFAFLTRLHPRWKLHGFRDKYILRLVGERYLPREIAWGPKGRFRVPLDTVFRHGAPAYVDQLLSDESLRKTGYFNPRAVHFWHNAHKEGRVGRCQKTAVEMGLVAVLATQLWHQIYIDSSLADLSGPWSRGESAREHELTPVGV